MDDTRRSVLRGGLAVGCAAVAGCSLLDGGGNEETVDGDGGTADDGDPTEGDGGTGGAGSMNGGDGQTTEEGGSILDSGRFSREAGWLDTHGSMARSGHNPGSDGPTDEPTEAWSVRLPPWSERLRLLAKDGVVLVARGHEQTRRLRAFDAGDGTERWTHTIQETVVGGPYRTVLADGVAAVVHAKPNDPTERTRALDLSSGEEVWERDGRFGTTHAGYLFRPHAINTDPLELEFQRWDTSPEQVDTIRLPSGDRPAWTVMVGDRFVYQPQGSKSTCRCLDLREGNEQWTASLPGPLDPRNAAPPLLAATPDVCFALPTTGDSFGATAVALAMADGSTLWSRRTLDGADGSDDESLGVSSLRLTSAGAVLFYASGGVEVRDHRTGDLEATPSSPDRRRRRGFLTADGTNAYFREQTVAEGEPPDTVVVATDPTGGTDRWQYPIAAERSVVRAIPADDTLYLLTRPPEADQPAPHRLHALR